MSRVPSFGYIYEVDNHTCVLGSGSRYKDSGVTWKTVFPVTSRLKARLSESLSMCVKCLKVTLDRRNLINSESAMNPFKR